ncbi:MAG: DUF1573 domain-containing protein [Muribaculaceae bacterium]|nr:DUF1573 domain-containing protein [Bacteroides sp.]MDE6194776.1 DUF1573 domain-containing protein [Muribaculaceae bacterium]
MKINKKYLYMAVGLIAVLLSAMPAFAKDNAKIDFNESVYDFGQISLKKGKVSHEFTFTNAGEKNLVITDARADCGCTRPEYSDAPVAPGKKGTVKVTFAPAAKGFFSKKVTITTNGSPRKTRLLIKGEVVD